MNQNHSSDTVDSAQLKVPQGLKVVCAVFAIIGIATFFAGMKFQPHRVWPNFLLNYFYFLALGVFGVFFTALQHITNAYWSVTVRRFAEALMSYLPVALVLGLVVIIGRHHLYEWTHTDVVSSDALLSLKAPYLNSKFFIARYVLILGLWIFFGFKMRKNSVLQDQSGDHKFTLSNIKLSALFIPFFAISFTLMSIDLLMSLEPHWFSTIFGVYCFAGMFYSGMSLLAILTIFSKKRGVLSDKIFNENHLHDIGKLMFAFTVFWAYIMFSQLMLIWYANLPEETPYYILRFNSGWFKVAVLLLIVHFIIPFFLLLPQGVKRCRSTLFKIAIFMLLAQWLDCYMMVMPVFFQGGPVFGWVEVGMFLGFFGVFVMCVSSFLQKVPVVPVKDPRFIQCLHHAQ